MPTAAQTLAKNSTPFDQLVWRLADHFPDCDFIRTQDLPPLTDDDLALVLNHESGIGIDACRPSEYADILNSAVYTTQAERDAALARNLRAAITHEARAFLVGDVNIELTNRAVRYGTPEQTLRAEWARTI